MGCGGGLEYSVRRFVRASQSLRFAQLLVGIRCVFSNNRRLSHRSRASTARCIDWARQLSRVPQRSSRTFVPCFGWPWCCLCLVPHATNGSFLERSSVVL